MYFVLKRLLDIFCSALALLVLSPLLLTVVIVLRYSGERKVFYLQERIGERNTRFGLVKFVTMLMNSPASGAITVKNDPRILPVGRFLRKTKINELPQLFNVLKGDMAIVGPRPLADQTFNYYSDELKSIIHQMKPGLTGLGSLVFRDEEAILFESDKDLEHCYQEDISPLKGLLEKWYFENRSFLVDLKLIIATAIAVVFSSSRFYLSWFPIGHLLQNSSLSHHFSREVS